MHSALGRDSPMPGQLDKRMAFKGTLLVKSLELTHAFASSQGNLMSLVGGDYNMTFTEVDQALRRDLKLEIQWEISDNDPNGNRDFMFATGGDLTKLDMTVLNFEGVHSLVAAAMPLPHTVPPVPRAGPPGALASSQGPGALASSRGPCVIAGPPGPHAGRAGCRGTRLDQSHAARPPVAVPEMHERCVYWTAARGLITLVLRA